MDLNKRIGDEDEEEKLEIWSTIMMMKDKKICLMYPIIIASSIGVALVTLIVPFMTDTMHELPIQEQLTLSA